MSRILSVNWEITRKCNLNCIYCRVCGGKEMTDELTEKQTKLVVDKLKLAGYQHLKFTGGEPLMKMYFWNLVRYAHGKGMIISFFTNGTLFTNKILSKIKKYISIVAVSLDTLVDEHNKILNRAKPGLVVDNIKKLKDLNIPIVISATVTKVNINDLSELIKFAKDNEIEEIKINDFVSSGRASDNFEILKLERPLIADLDKIRGKIGETFKEDVSVKIHFRCECSKDNLFINYRGDLYPCVELSYISEKFCLGNIVKDSLPKLLVTNQNFYKQIKKTNYCGYSYMFSKHFSACLNRSSCPSILLKYMKNASQTL